MFFFILAIPSKIISRFLPAPLKYLCCLLMNQQAVGCLTAREERITRIEIGDAWLLRFSSVQLPGPEAERLQVVNSRCGDEGETQDAHSLSPTPQQLNYTWPAPRKESRRRKRSSQRRVAGYLLGSICEIRDLFVRERWQSLSGSKGDAAQWWRVNLSTSACPHPTSRSRPSFSPFDLPPVSSSVDLSHFPSHLFSFVWEFITEKERVCSPHWNFVLSFLFARKILDRAKMIFV